MADEFEEKRFQDGLASGIAAAKALGPIGKSEPIGPDAMQIKAWDQAIAAGGKLGQEEQAKRAKNQNDLWDDIGIHSAEGRFPKGNDVFLFKGYGLFYVAPAQEGYMCRLRIPNGILNTYQFRGIADLAERHAHPHTDVTTRANLQIREIRATEGMSVLTGLVELGLSARGSGADNIRNVTGSPLAGIDPQELIDTRPFAKEWQHFLYNHREMYTLPRKFNVAFDGGGSLTVLEDTNDIGFGAVRVGPGKAVPEGVYFRMELGGITGHRDFARDTGVMLEGRELIPVAAAIVRIHIKNGSRTDRKRSRLKYILDDWGFEKFLTELEAELGRPLLRFPRQECEPRGPLQKHGHIGAHPQLQPGLSYIGVLLPVGRVTCAQMRGLADIADRWGSSTIRLTVWQNIIISDVAAENIPAVEAAIEALGLATRASEIRGGLVACTGNQGCKFAAADTKGHAMKLAAYLEARLTLDVPVNIHLTGCHNSCAQHYIGDIGMIAAKVPVGEGEAAIEVEGYTVCVGGGYGPDRAIARELWPNLPYDAIPPRVAALLRAYLDRRAGEESFNDFVRRHSTDELAALGDTLSKAA